MMVWLPPTDAGDLQRFADDTFAQFFPSHVLEHFDHGRIVGEAH
jgi:predicted SAM-dependent methyltransferase